MNIENEAIIVTGGTGFVGRHCTEALLSRGVAPANILSVCNNSEPANLPIEQMRLDITDEANVSKIIAQVQPKAVIHLAAVANPSFAEANSRRAWMVNLDGTRNLASAIMQASPRTKLIFASSSEAYGESFNNERLPISELSALRPKTVYGATKAAADIMLNQMAEDGLDVMVFRAFNHTGPGQDTSYVIPSFAKQIEDLKVGTAPPVISVGNLDAERDFLDVRDVVSAYVSAALTSTKFETSTLNLCSGVPRSIKSILMSLIRLAEVDVEVNVDPDRMRPSEVPRAYGDNHALKTHLNWHPTIEMDETLQDVLNFFGSELSAH